MIRENMTRKGWIAAALLVLFGLMLSPPVVFWVNTDAFVAGWPVTLLWAVGWATFAVLVLAWAALNDAFALNDDQIPPELREREEVVAPDETTPGRGVEPERGDA